MKTAIGVVGLCLAVAPPVVSATIDVELMAEVSDPGDPFLPAALGDPVILQFSVSSDDFVESADGHVRRYVVDSESFRLTIGGGTALLDPAGAPAYFVIQDVDGGDDRFALEDSGGAGVPIYDPITSSGGAVMGFSLTYDGSTLASPAILDAMGTYDAMGLISSGLLVFLPACGPACGPTVMAYEEMTISAPVPVAATTWSALKARHAF